MSVLMKALLVHGAKQDDAGKQHIEQALKDARKSGQFKQVITRYLGYGAVGYRACADLHCPASNRSGLRRDKRKRGA
ncbi:hypothetical protein [Castellaniella sp.]|uniref:hypothetical protein n=1 Tax=Castellaniella sp. TaxID=1955812 RepID=UPI002AFE0729|nr:hypothetical protein [Castellaniella sp.]